MEPRRVSIAREVHEGSSVQGRFMLTDSRSGLDELLQTHAGQIKLIYLDPPYQTGERFVMRVRVGQDEWKSGRGTLPLETFSDNLDWDAFLGMMREVLTKCHALLRDDGMIFLHIDYRTHAHLRLMMDDIFGAEHFLNEIIWVYQSGGRSLRYFSRKHDTILFYRKSSQYDFNVHEIMTVPTQPRSNHMRKHVDPDGRVYRSIRSNGRVYTYYDDDPVAPSDVWNDLSHLQQKDPERIGYDTQKPLSLLERIVKCGSRAGDIVLDPFAGSGTTLEAAKRCGRDFIGIDCCPMTLNIARRRLEGAAYALQYPAFDGNPHCEASAVTGIGFYHVTLDAFQPEEGVCERAFEGLDCVDNWSVGYIRSGEYFAMAQSARSKREPQIARSLDAPAYEGTLAMCVNDVFGRSFCYAVDLQQLPH